MDYEEFVKGVQHLNGVPKVQTAPSLIPFMFPIEHRFDQHAMLEWFERNWTDSIFYCAGYLLAIYVGRVNKSFEK